MPDSPSKDRAPTRAEQIIKLGRLSARSQRDADTVTIALRGEMDLANAGNFESELLRVEATDASRIVLDLDGLSFIDSTGLRLLLMADSRSRADGDRLVLRRPSGALLRVLQLTGLDARLRFAAD